MHWQTFCVVGVENRDDKIHEEVREDITTTRAHKDLHNVIVRT